MTLDELHPGMSGRFLVTTQGTTHVWDLNDMTYERRPGPDSKAGSFDYDQTPHRITRVVAWPRVGGRSFLFFDDPECPQSVEHYRVSSTIVEIRRIA